jgi:hypothetical protein
MIQQENTDPQFEALLDYLRNHRGFDFTGYKRSSLMRRVSQAPAHSDVEQFWRIPGLFVGPSG